jgi:quercetin dioxygenase-like cupin family protein
MRSWLGTVVLLLSADLLLAQKPTARGGQANGLTEWRTVSDGVERMDLVVSDSPTELKAFRIRYRAGLPTDSGAHYHLGTEHVVVLKGTLALGFGERLDPTKVTRYGPGSFIVIPVGSAHFEWLEGEVEAHVETVGNLFKTVWLTHNRGKQEQ